ncbi:MAG: DUF6088 family protein [Psychrosphaera sp.]|nr:DUF6088 family protein [Psychrosphaera sp.]
MSVANQVRVNIAKLATGSVFLVSDMPTYATDKKATTKALSHFAQSKRFKQRYGDITRIADGLYYKDKIGLLGHLPPSFDAIITALTYKKNQRVGYINGHQLYNRKGLTAQVPATITLVTSKQAPTKISVAGMTIEVERKKKAINPSDIIRYEFENILNNINAIQDIDTDGLIHAVGEYFDHFAHSPAQFKKMLKQLTYKRTKALLGALLEGYQTQSTFDFSSYLTLIKKELSQHSEYKMGHLANHLSHGETWNIAV